VKDDGMATPLDTLMILQAVTGSTEPNHHQKKRYIRIYMDRWIDMKREEDEINII